MACSPTGRMSDEKINRLIEAHHFGGILLFKRSCPDSDSIRYLVEALQRRAEIPLLVMIDQEGGRVMRILEDRFRLPSARELASCTPGEIEEKTHFLASRLFELGINVNLAPVLDVDSNSDNPVIGDRAFGSDVETVWTCALAYHRGLTKGGLIGCGKHFPGHGDTDLDSHLALPTVSHDLERLMQLEIEPFKRAVEAGFDMIMAAHVLYKALDPDEPASLSEKICTGLLRRQLGFKGVIIADDLEMKAVAERYPTRELVSRLLVAGVDLLPVCHSYDLAVDVHRSLIRLVEDGEVAPERLKASYDRIVDLKRKFQLLEGKRV